MRWILYLLGTLVLLIVLLAAAVVILVDPNDYKEEIAATVSEQTGREFAIEGDLSLKLLPCCGIRLGPLALGNPAGFPAGNFARIEDATVSVRLLPLLMDQELQAGKIELDGLDVRLIQRADGSNNWDFSTPDSATAGTAETDSGPGLGQLDIAGVSVSNSRLSYLDEAAGEPVTLSGLTLNTGRIRLSDPIDLTAAFTVEGLAPDTTAALDLGTQVNLSADLATADVTDLTGQVTLTGPDLPGGAAKIDLALAAARNLGGDESPLEGLKATIGTGDLKLDVTAGGALAADGPRLSGTLLAAPFAPRKLLENMGGEPVVTADPQALQRLEMRGDWTLAGDTAAVENLRLKLDDSTISGWLRVNSLEREAAEFDLQIDKLNLDRYLAPADETAAAGGASGTPASSGDEALDLPMEELRALDLTGRFGIGELQVTDAQLTDVTVNLVARKGSIRLNPLTASLYGGGYDGDLRLNVKGDQPELSLNEKLTGVKLSKLLADTRDSANLTGLGNIRIKGTARGNSINALLGNLSGDAALELKDGSYEGVDIWYEIRRAYAQLRGKKMPAAPASPRTEISQFNGTAQFKDGKLSNDDFTAQIPFIRMRGRGNVDLLQSLLDYRLEATVVGTPTFADSEPLDELKGLVLPITLKGDMSGPTVSVDLAAIAVSVGERKLRERLMKKLGIPDDADEGAPADGAQPQKEDDAKSADPKEQLKKSLFDLLGN